MVEAPVVVNPAMDSKKASTGPMIPERTNGSAPAVATPNHPRTTIRNTSCLKIRASGRRVRKKSIVPRAIVPNAGSPKARVFPSAVRSEKAAGRSIPIPPAAITAPSALAITLGCKEPLYLIYSGLDCKDDRVVPGSEHLPAGGNDDVPVSQERPDDGSLGEPHLGERTARHPAPLGNAQLYHLGPALQEGYVYNLALSHESKDGFGCQDARRDRQIHSKGVG